MPGDPGATVVANSCAFYILHARLRVQRAPGIPARPLLIGGGRIMNNSGAVRAAGTIGVDASFGYPVDKTPSKSDNFSAMNIRQRARE
jgi:hypothetical protein